MESVSKLEAMVAKWYEKAPHLPANGRKWLAENVWWLALIGLILMIFAMFGLFSLLFLSGAVLVGVAGVAGAVIGGAIWIAALVGAIFLLVQLVLTAMAVSPLKNMQKRGWTLLFIVALLNVAADILTFIFKFNLFDLIWGLIMAALGAYFLFEIRSSFVAAKVDKKAAPAKVVTKKA